MTEEELIELLAALAHEQWSGWMKCLFDGTIEVGDGCEEIQSIQVVHWKRQMTTPYAELSEREKDSDRVEARRVMDLLRQHKEGLSGEVMKSQPELKKPYKEIAELVASMCIQYMTDKSFSDKNFVENLEFYGRDTLEKFKTQSQV